MRMKILLVRVPLISCCAMEYHSFSYFAEPTGLNYIAQSLCRMNQAVDIYDMFLDPDPNHLLEQISKYKPRVVGFSSLILGYDNIELLSGMIKYKFPNIEIAVGGPCTCMPTNTMMAHNQWVDFIIKGEGEVSFAQLCGAIENEALSELSHIDGLAYRRNGRIIANQKRKYIDAESIDFPVDRYRSYKPYMRGSIITTVMGEPPIAFIEASRGCKFKCNFCGVSEPYRKRPAFKVVKEMSLLCKTYGVRKFIFADYSFTADQEHAMEICRLIIENGLNVEWGCDTRIDCVSLPLLRLMKRSGCRIIFYGIESFCQKTLNALKKGTTVAGIRKGLENTRKVRIQSLAYMMLGAPGETREMILRNSEILNKCKVDYALWGIVRLFSGTPLFDKAAAIGLIDKRRGQEACMQGNIDHIPVYCDTLTYNEMKQLEMLVIKKFYFRISYVFNKLLSLRDLKELYRLIKQLKYLVVWLTFRRC